MNELLRPDEVRAILRIGRSKVYEMIARGELPWSASAAPCVSRVPSWSDGSPSTRAGGSPGGRPER